MLLQINYIFCIYSVIELTWIAQQRQNPMFMLSIMKHGDLEVNVTMFFFHGLLFVYNKRLV